MIQVTDFEKVYFLGRCAPFANLSPTVLGAVAVKCSAVKLEKGERICTEGEEIDALYTVMYGSLDVVVNRHKVDEIGAGYLVGEHEIFTGNQHAKATVEVQSSYARLLQITRESVLDLMEHEPAFLVKMAQMFADRYQQKKKEISRWDKLHSHIQRDLSFLESSLENIKRLVEIEQEKKGSKIELRYVVSVQEGQCLNKAQHFWQEYVVLKGST